MSTSSLTGASAYRTQIGGSWAASLRGSEHFPDPFMDMASLAMPESVKNMLLWSEFIWTSSHVYRAAMERVLAYFLTDLTVGGEAGDDEKEDFKELLEHDLSTMKAVAAVARDQLCYGNAFFSLLYSFKRLLRCGKCHSLFPLRVVHSEPVFKFKFSSFRFYAVCPKCKYNGEWEEQDELLRNKDAIRPKHWSPHEIEILDDPLTNETRYFWRIPESYRKIVAKGTLHHLERVSRPILDALRTKRDFEFNPDAILHVKEPTLTGTPSSGWGYPRTMINFRQIWYNKILERYNEAIALDYVIPFRVITPQARSGSGAGGGQHLDPLLTVNMGDFMSQVRGMLRRRRRDPASWHTLPFPVEYQALGGDATQFAPRELLDQGIDTLLNASNVPVDFYKGSMTVQAAPTALRLFQSSWRPLVDAMDYTAQWIADRVADYLHKDKFKVRLSEVRHADDLNRQSAQMQLMMAQQMSGTTAFQSVGANWREEQRRLIEEQKFQAELQQKAQEDMASMGLGTQMAQGQLGAPPPGGTPAPGGSPASPASPVSPTAPAGDPAAAPPPSPVSQVTSGSGTRTPEDVMAQAESLAAELQSMPSSQRISQLRQLKQQDETLHAMVKAKLEQIRSQASSQGRQMVLQQQYGQA